VKKDKQFAFKIVRVASKYVPGKMPKLMSSVIQGDLALQYKPLKWTRAKWRARRRGYHPLVFDTYLHATEMAAGNPAGMYEVWCCEIDGVVENIPPSGMAHPLGRSLRLGGDWPVGTIMAKRVKLLRRVY